MFSRVIGQLACSETQIGEHFIDFLGDEDVLEKVGETFQTKCCWIGKTCKLWRRAPVLVLRRNDGLEKIGFSFNSV